MLGRHGRVTEATAGRRILRRVNHLPLGDTERINKAKPIRVSKVLLSEKNQIDQQDGSFMLHL